MVATKTTNLMTASWQWAIRPPDERYASLQEMLEASAVIRQQSRESEIKIGRIKVVNEAENLYITDNTNEARAIPTHYSFAQLCHLLDFPPSSIQEKKLSADLAAKVLNYRLGKVAQDKDIVALTQTNGHVKLRSITSTKYSRLWNEDLIRALLPLQQNGWVVPPALAINDDPRARPATKDDLTGISAGGGKRIEVGDMISPSGLYMSDRDMFIFMVNKQNRIDDGTEDGLYRGFFFTNSEVGASAVKGKTFLFRGVCGNHIIWSAQNVIEFSYKHVGEVQKRAFDAIASKLNTYNNAGTQEIEVKIKWLKEHNIANDEDGVVDEVRKMDILGLGKKKIEAAYDLATKYADVDFASPRSWWGLSQGVSRLSQETLYTDKRNELDIASGHILNIGVKVSN